MDTLLLCIRVICCLIGGVGPDVICLCSVLFCALSLEGTMHTVDCGVLRYSDGRVAVVLCWVVEWNVVPEKDRTVVSVDFCVMTGAILFGFHLVFVGVAASR